MRYALFSLFVIFYSIQNALGGSGIVRLTLTEDARASRLIVLPDAKSLLCGTHYQQGPTFTESTFFMVRLLPDGSPDKQFGKEGLVRFSEGVFDVALQEDGKIILAGSDWQTPHNLAFLAIRLTADGKIDPSFGNNGRVLVDITPGEDSAGHVLIDKQGILLLGNPFTGEFKSGKMQEYIATVKLLPNGQLDASYGTQGKQLTPIPKGFHLYGRGIIRKKDGGIFVLAEKGKWIRGGLGSAFEPYLLSLNSQGKIDKRYSQDGFKALDRHGKVLPLGPFVLSDGSFYVAGDTRNSPEEAFKGFVWRFTPSGEFDPNFGENGALTFRHFIPRSVAVRSETTIHIGGSGYESNGGIEVPTIVRVNQFGKVDTGFGKDGFLYSPNKKNDPWGTTALLAQDPRSGKLSLALSESMAIPAGSKKTSQVHILRFTEDGIPDLASFGADIKLPPMTK